MCRGTINEVKDSSVVFRLLSNNKELLIPASRIDMMQVNQEKGGGGRTATKGFALGALFGVGLALIPGSSNDEGFSISGGDLAPVFGFVGELFGGLVGAAMHTTTIEIPINGDQRNFQMQKEKIRRLSLD